TPCSIRRTGFFMPADDLRLGGTVMVVHDFLSCRPAPAVVPPAPNIVPDDVVRLLIKKPV
ncbi:hypothetical protein, partial [Aurantivibrio plasticivorans]